jgi:hypothetical protein
LFLYGNNQPLQSKFADFVPIAARLAGKNVKVQAVTAKSLSIDVTEDPALFQERNTKLYIVEKVGDSFAAKIEEILSSQDIFVLIADSYKLAKKITEQLVAHPLCDCLGFFTNDNKVVLAFAQIICSIAMPGVQSSGDLVRSIARKLTESDTNIMSIIFDLEMLGNDMPVYTQSSPTAMAELISGMEPISAIRFYMSGLCKSLGKDSTNVTTQKVETIKKLWKLEKNVKLGIFTDPASTKAAIYQSVSTSEAVE